MCERRTRNSQKTGKQARERQQLYPHDITSLRNTFHTTGGFCAPVWPERSAYKWSPHPNFLTSWPRAGFLRRPNDPLDDPLHDSNVALRPAVKDADRSLISSAVVRGNRLLHAIELDEYGSLA